MGFRFFRDLGLRVDSSLWVRSLEFEGGFIGFNIGFTGIMYLYSIYLSLEVTPKYTLYEHMDRVALRVVLQSLFFLRKIG